MFFPSLPRCYALGEEYSNEGRNEGGEKRNGLGSVLSVTNDLSAPQGEREGGRDPPSPKKGPMSCLQKISPLAIFCPPQGDIRT